MTKKKEEDLGYGEIDIILQAHADTMKEVDEIAKLLVEKYEGGMNPNTAREAAKDYFMFGKVLMNLDPAFRKKTEAKVKKLYTERLVRLRKLNEPKEEVKNA